MFSLQQRDFKIRRNTSAERFYLRYLNRAHSKMKIKTTDDMGKIITLLVIVTEILSFDHSFVRKMLKQYGWL